MQYYLKTRRLLDVMTIPGIAHAYSAIFNLPAVGRVGKKTTGSHKAGKPVPT
jgi:hypothetical protein